MSIITSADFPAVRAAILVDLSSAELADETIALPIYQGAAEARLQRLVAPMTPQPDLTSDDAKNAVIYWVAGLIAPTILQTRLTGETFVDYRYTVAAPTQAQEAADVLTARGDESFQLLIGNTATADRSVAISMAHGRRWA